MAVESLSVLTSASFLKGGYESRVIEDSKNKIVTNQNKDNSRKIYSPDFLTPQERQDRIVEILTRGVLRLIEKKRQAPQQSKAIRFENSEEK